MGQDIIETCSGKKIVNIFLNLTAACMMLLTQRIEEINYWTGLMHSDDEFYDTLLQSQNCAFLNTLKYGCCLW
jgi:hypothetical protein